MVPKTVQIDLLLSELEPMLSHEGRAWEQHHQEGLGAMLEGLADRAARGGGDPLLSFPASAEEVEYLAKVAGEEAEETLALADTAEYLVACAIVARRVEAGRSMGVMREDVATRNSLTPWTVG